MIKKVGKPIIFNVGEISKMDDLRARSAGNQLIWKIFLKVKYNVSAWRPHQRAISLSSLFTKFLIKWIFLNFTTSDFERISTVIDCH